MAEMMVDSNVLLDVLTEDPVWLDWSTRTLEEYAQSHILVINPIIYAEVSIAFDRSAAHASSIEYTSCMTSASSRCPRSC